MENSIKYWSQTKVVPHRVDFFAIDYLWNFLLMSANVHYLISWNCGLFYFVSKSIQSIKCSQFSTSSLLHSLNFIFWHEFFSNGFSIVRSYLTMCMLFTSTWTTSYWTFSFDCLARKSHIFIEFYLRFFSRLMFEQYLGENFYIFEHNIYIYISIVFVCIFIFLQRMFCMHFLVVGDWESGYFFLHGYGFT